MKSLYHLSFEGEAFWAHKASEGYRTLDGDPISEGIANLRSTTRLLPEKGIQLLPPCGRSKVLALAFNYQGVTNEETSKQEPLFFLKAVTSLVGSGHNVKIPAFVKEVWVEVELALIIGKGGSHIQPMNVADHILGYTIGNDITAANLYGRDCHLARSKSLDGFCPLGPALIPGMPPPGLAIRTTINGRTTQDGNTNDRLVDDVGSVVLLSNYVTLEPGDVILTGTCTGTNESKVRSGDQVRMSIEGGGELETNFIS